MTDERLKQLMEQVGMPNSRSLYDALRQAYMEGYQQLEAENKRLREALEARRDWFAAQLKSASKGNFSEWDRHALQIELDAANEALS